MNFSDDTNLGQKVAYLLPEAPIKLNLKICAFTKEFFDGVIHMALLEFFNNLGNKDSKFYNLGTSVKIYTLKMTKHQLEPKVSTKLPQHT